MTCKEIAKRISAHLERFERDKTINARSEKRGIPPYFSAFAVGGGRYVRVQYISFQGQSSLTKAEAEAYLAWLDSGRVGRHFEQQKEAQRTAGCVATGGDV